MTVQPPDSRAEFAAAVRPELDRLLRGAVLLCGNRHQAEDLLQSVLVRVLVNGRWRGAEHLYAYLRQCLTNEFLGTRRRRSAGDVSVDDTDAGLFGTWCDPDPSERIDLFRALDQLPRLDRAVVVLRYWEDLSVVETAAVLGVSPGAVRTRCGRALARLRTLYRSDHEQPVPTRPHWGPSTEVLA